MSLKFVATVVRPVLLVSIVFVGGVVVWRGMKPDTAQIQSVPPISIPLFEPKINLSVTRAQLGNEVLQLRGSNTMAGPRKERLEEAFAGKGITLNPLFGSSTAGLDYLKQFKEQPAVAFISSSLAETETALEAFQVAEEEIVLYVGRNSVFTRSSLTAAEACDVLLGKDSSLKLIQRDVSSGTRKWVEKQCGGEDQKPLSVVKDSTQVLFQALSANPQAVGYAGLDQAQSMVRSIRVDGWPKRPIFAVVRKDAPLYLKTEVIPFIKQVLKQP